MIEMIVWSMGAVLATKEKYDEVFASHNWVADLKKDGMWVTVHIGIGENFTNRIFTRGDSVFEPGKPIEVTHRLPHLAKMVFQYVPIGTVLAAEAYIPGVAASFVAGKMNAKSDKPTDSRIILSVFDCMILENEDFRITKAPWHKRRSALTFITRLMNRTTESWGAISECVSNTTLNPTATRDFADAIIAAGGEGVVLKWIHSPYVENGRSIDWWIKYKKKMDFDCVFIDVIMAKKGKTGQMFGKIGSIVLGMYDRLGNMVEVGRCSGMDATTRDDITVNWKSYVNNKVVVVSCMERPTAGGKLRLPQFEYIRAEGDKNPTECKTDIPGRPHKPGHKLEGGL